MAVRMAIDFIGLLVLGLSFLGYYFIFIKVLKVASEDSLFLIFSSCIFILYVFSYFDKLYYGAWAIIILGYFGIILSFFIFRKERGHCFLNYITPVFVVFLFYAALFSFLSSGLHFLSDDELSHWAPHALYLFLNNGFIKADDISGHLCYPPGGSLFYYLFYLAHGFSESKTYIAQQLLILSSIPIVLKGVRWKDWPLAFIGFSLVLCLLKVLGVKMGYQGSLVMDPFVGIYLGSVIIYYRTSKQSSVNILWLIPPTFALLLFKWKLLPIGMVVLGIVCADQLLRAIIFYKNNKKIDVNIIIARGVAMMALFISSLLAVTSWSRYLLKNKIPVEWGLNVKKAEIFKVIFGIHQTTHQALVVHNFIHYFFTHVLPLLSIFLICIFLVCLLLKIKKEKYQFFLLDNVVLLAAFFVYLMGLLALYLFTFDTYEGIILASFSRYAGIFYIAWTLIIFAGAFRALKLYKIFQRRIIQWPVIICIGALFFFVWLANYSHSHRPDIAIRNQWLFRQNIREITDAVKKVTKKNDRIYVIWQNSRGYSAIVIRYEMIPWRTSLTMSSFSRHPDWDNGWVQNWSAEKLAEELKTYDYLLIGHVDHEFWAMFGKLFSKDPSQYKPLLTYQLCAAKTGPYPVLAKGCQMITDKAYLFKITYNDGKINFVDVK